MDLLPRTILGLSVALTGCVPTCPPSGQWVDSGYTYNSQYCMEHRQQPQAPIAPIVVNCQTVDLVLVGLRADGVRVVNSYTDPGAIEYARKWAMQHGGTPEDVQSTAHAHSGTIFVPWEPGQELTSMRTAPDLLDALLTYVHEYQHILQQRASHVFDWEYGYDMRARAWYEAEAQSAERDLLAAAGVEYWQLDEAWLAAYYGTGSSSVEVYRLTVLHGDYIRTSGHAATAAGAAFIRWMSSVYNV